MTIQCHLENEISPSKDIFGYRPLDSFNRWCLKTVPGELYWPEQRFGGLPRLFDNFMGHAHTTIFIR